MIDGRRSAEAALLAAVALEAKVEIMITHTAGHMFGTDLRDGHFTVI